MSVQTRCQFAMREFFPSSRTLSARRDADMRAEDTVMVVFNRIDLENTLTQILMAEAGQPPVNVHLAFGLCEGLGTDNSPGSRQSFFGFAAPPFPPPAVVPPLPPPPRA